MPDHLDPQTISYLFMEDNRRFAHLARRPTLRYSFYRAFDHHFTSDVQVALEL